jgi:hypothetical protein
VARCRTECQITTPLQRLPRRAKVAYFNESHGYRNFDAQSLYLTIVCTKAGVPVPDRDAIAQATGLEREAVKTFAFMTAQGTMPRRTMRCEWTRKHGYEAYDKLLSELAWLSDIAMTPQTLQRLRANLTNGVIIELKTNEGQPVFSDEHDGVVTSDAVTQKMMDRCVARAVERIGGVEATWLRNVRYVPKKFIEEPKDSSGVR